MRRSRERADGGRGAAARHARPGRGAGASSATRPSRATSSQEAFARTLQRPRPRARDVARRLVTTSPDVSISTGLGGWINRRGVFAPTDEADATSSEQGTPLRWEPSPRGQHLELGISEMNLFLLLGQLGLSYELQDVQLLPDRHGLRPVRLPRARRADLRHVHRRALRGRRHARRASRCRARAARTRARSRLDRARSCPASPTGSPATPLEVEWVLLESRPAHGRPRGRARRRTCGSRRRRSTRRRSWSGWRRWAATRRARPCCPAPTGSPGRRAGSSAGAW